MASASSSTEMNYQRQLDYDKAKSYYLTQVNKNTDLFKGKLCTRATIEEKIREITAFCTTRDFVVEMRDGIAKLLIKGRTINVEILAVEDAFDVLLQVHINSNHGTATTMYNIIKSKYYIPTCCVSWVIESCNVCHGNSESETAAPEADIDKKITRSEVNIRGVWRMNIIKDSLDPNHKSRYRYLLIYREYNTNFLVLRPLFETSEELAIDILKLFVEFGYPEIVYVPNMIGYYKDIFRIVYAINPVAEVPIRIAPDDVFEDDKIEVLTELRKWQDKSKNSYWEQNCLLVQYKINTTQKCLTKMGSQEISIGIPFNLFFNYESNKKDSLKPPLRKEDKLIQKKN